MKVLLICAILPVLATAAGIRAAARELFDDCANPRFAKGECAKLFDDDKCEGWEYPVPTGYKELGFRKRNDAESLIVKAGCKFTGYDHDGKTIKERGNKVEVDARQSSTPVQMELKGHPMNEKISSMDCFCDPESRPIYG